MGIIGNLVSSAFTSKKKAYTTMVLSPEHYLRVAKRDARKARLEERARDKTYDELKRMFSGKQKFGPQVWRQKFDDYIKEARTEFDFLIEIWELDDKILYQFDEQHLKNFTSTVQDIIRQGYPREQQGPLIKAVEEANQAYTALLADLKSEARGTYRQGLMQKLQTFSITGSKRLEKEMKLDQKRLLADWKAFDDLLAKLQKDLREGSIVGVEKDTPVIVALMRDELKLLNEIIEDDEVVLRRLREASSEIREWIEDSIKQRQLDEVTGKYMNNKIVELLGYIESKENLLRRQQRSQARAGRASAASQDVEKAA